MIDEPSKSHVFVGRYSISDSFNWVFSFGMEVQQVANSRFFGQGIPARVGWNHSVEPAVPAAPWPMQVHQYSRENLNTTVIYSGSWLNPTPVKHMSQSVGMMTLPPEWKNKIHVPDHQLDIVCSHKENKYCFSEATSYLPGGELYTWTSQGLSQVKTHGVVEHAPLKAYRWCCPASDSLASQITLWEKSCVYYTLVT